MRFDIMTLFPEAVAPMLNASILGRAQKKGLIEIHAHQIRDYTTNKQNQVDDYPYGGGRGAIMQCDPLWRCWCAICDEIGAPVHTVFLSPCGPSFDQAKARQLQADYYNLILVSAFSTNASTKRSPWAISCSRAARSRPWRSSTPSRA